MAFDEVLAERVRGALRSGRAVAEKRMFGGLSFMEDGRMIVGVSGNDLIVRFDAATHDEVMRLPHVRPFDLSSRPTRGWALVGPEGSATRGAVEAWIRRARDAPIAKPRRGKA